jgi:hypothetical protein
MNLKTTLLLLALVAGGAAVWLLGPALPSQLSPTSREPGHGESGTLQVLSSQIVPGELSRIDIVARGSDRPLLLERSPGGAWTAPGQWPTRKPEVEQLIALLTGLHSRFVPLPIKGENDLKTYDLDQPEVIVTLKAGSTDYRLALAEKTPPDEPSMDRLAMPTWLRLDTRPEIVRLGPGLVGELSRPPSYYLQRRLFPFERVAKGDDAADKQEKVEQLKARSIAVEEKKPNGIKYVVTHADTNWELSQPARDRLDPDRLKSLLRSAPDIWAEQFVAWGDKGLAKYGLKDPEQVVRVTDPDGATVVLLIGSESPTRKQRPSPPPPPGLPPDVPPPPPVVETFRYAKLENNDQVFEIKADRLRDLFVRPADLRDARLARFRADDARRLEIKYEGQDIVLAKEKDRWHLEKPLKADAETSKVNELLDKLAGLEARDADVIDNADAKIYGFDDPAKVGHVVVTVEEEKSEGAAKKKETRTLTFSLGKDDKDKKKLYVRSGDWPRINAVDDGLVSLAKRPALAYRGRRVLDFVAGDLDRIEVKRGSETIALKRDKGQWKLLTPAPIDADAAKAGGLAGSLGNLEAAEYVNDAPKPDELERYGLAKDALTASLTFEDTAKKPAQTLLVGKAVPEKPGEFYAKLGSGPSVFAVKKDVRDALDQGALAYRPLQLWQVPAEDVTALRVRQAGQEEYRLTRKDGAWRIGGPFDAPAQETLVEPMLSELAAPRCERYETAAAPDLKQYGLDQPHLRLVLAMNKPDAKERTLLVGKATADPQQRFAKLADADAIFVVGGKLTSALDRGALDLLDRQLLTLDPKTIERVQVRGAGPLTLERKGDAWRVTESPAPATFTPDSRVVNGVLSAWSHLQAMRFTAYGAKADLAKYGLDKPETTATITVQAGEVSGKKAPPQTHTLALGKPVEASSGERYARLDNGPGIVVLPAFSVGELTHGYLDFVDHSLLRFDASTLAGLKRQASGEVLEVGKKDEWHIIKPTDQKADDKIMQGLAEGLSGLRAVRIVAYPAKDIKPFGLDAPAAVLTVDFREGAKPVQRVLRIGKPATAVAGSAVVAGAVVAGAPDPATAAQPPDRFAQVEGSQAVAVIPGPLADQLLAAPIRFRDRAIARFADADKVILERGPRTATFANVDGTWKLTAPTEASAEQTELDDFVNAVARLHADELVAEKPADLKPYGLDKPEAHWRFMSGAKEVLNLLVGGPDKGGHRRYAKLASGDVVFLLDAPTTNRVLAEYRTRTVWPTPLDAAQVESVRFGYGRNAFTLTKVDNLWQVVGKPGELVNIAAVNETLDALSRLRVERYVLDKGADPKLYGLEPPELTIDLQTPTGRRTLQIGRTEGESKRYYARVPDKDRSDVFVLSEAEGARIVRDLHAFTEKTPKPRKP